MKLARTTFVVVRNDDLRREVRNVRRMARPNIPRAVTLRRPADQLVATWHVDPQTRGLACAWSTEPAPAEEGSPLPRINAARRQRAPYRRRQ